LFSRSSGRKLKDTAETLENHKHFLGNSHTNFARHYRSSAKWPRSTSHASGLFRKGGQAAFLITRIFKGTANDFPFQEKPVRADIFVVWRFKNEPSSVGATSP
jgi:hypothetical protein